MLTPARHQNVSLVDRSGVLALDDHEQGAIGLAHRTICSALDGASGPAEPASIATGSDASFRGDESKTEVVCSAACSADALPDAELDMRAQSTIPPQQESAPEVLIEPMSRPCGVENGGNGGIHAILALVATMEDRLGAIGHDDGAMADGADAPVLPNVLAGYDLELPTPPRLDQFLADLNLAKYTTQLRDELGAATPAHLKDLDEEDMDNIGLKKLEKKRLARALQGL
eukprot:SAG31_NODE_8019_length_1539_cov_1.450694_1_plen_229_part_00